MELFLVIFISLITFITRRVNLLNIPIFTDEAIYIRWAQIGLNDPAHRYISLTDGKQPLLTWLMYPTLMIFSDPLFAGRFVSVVVSIFSVLGIYFVSRKLFGRKTAIFSAIVYIISPFALIYDRLALMDSLLACLGIWSMYFTILLVENPRLDYAFLLGMSVGLGFLTKSSALFYLCLIPAALLLFDFKSTKKKINKLLKFIGLSLISIIMSEIIYNSLRLSPWFYMIEQKNYTFIYSVGEIIKSPFKYFLPNLHGLLNMLLPYLTLPIDMILIVAALWMFFKRDRKILYLFVWFLFPFLSLAFFGKVIFPRFLLFMVMPLFIISGFILSKIFVFALHKMKVFLLLIPLLLIYPAYQSYLVIFSPIDVNIPVIDRNQLFDDWPSGYGVKEVISYLLEKSKTSKIIVGTEGTFGLNPAVYEIYLGNNKNVEIYGFWPIFEVPALLIEKSKQYPTFLIFKERQDVPTQWPLDLVGKYRRGKGNTYLLFYQVNPSKHQT